MEEIVLPYLRVDDLWRPHHLVQPGRVPVPLMVPSVYEELHRLHVVVPPVVLVTDVFRRPPPRLSRQMPLGPPDRGGLVFQCPASLQV